MNERYDPLGDYGGRMPDTAPEPPKKPRRMKEPGLLKAVAGIPDGTLAFLYASSFGQNRDGVQNVRKGFAAFCEREPHFPDWRQAWSAFIAQEKSRIAAPPEAEPVKTPVTLSPWRDQWRRRLHRATF